MPAYGAAATIVDRLDALRSESVLPWGCPVPYFGRLSRARLATIGINPSSREFTDAEGVELDGADRRLPTLRSLGLMGWSYADATHLRVILEACDSYFHTRPYDRWFKVLEAVLQGIGGTYYGEYASACHLDLVPYATSAKWGSLTADERRLLLETSRPAVGLFLRESSIELLLLNGKSVVKQFEQIADVTLHSAVVPGWGLPRTNGRHVSGVAYWGSIERIGGVELPRRVGVVGYNHNLQSSFGVTSEVLRQIREWMRSAPWEESG